MAKMICGDCKTVDEPKVVMRGSIIIELALWVLLCAPGLLYRIWRVTTRQRLCRMCDRHDLVDVESARGKELLHGRPV